MTRFGRCKVTIWQLALLLAATLACGQAMAQLTITPITWDVVGLDHNRPLTSGPELFPVGAEVCSSAAATNVQVDFLWTDGNGSGWDFGTGHPFINLRPGSLTSLAFPSIGAGECRDAYFELRLNRSAAAFGQVRPYTIQASDAALNTASTPSNRQIRIEQLVSQNRNTTTLIRYGEQADESDWQVLGAGGSINLAVGNTYFIELTTQTATAYEELQSFLTLSNTIFQVLEVSTTYSTRTAPLARVPDPNPRLWADGCLWDSQTDSPNYHSCLDAGKAGGVVVTTYQIFILSGGGDQVGLEALIYDLSGGSFHYNTDFSQSPGDLNTFDPAASGFSKRFLPSTTSIGGISRLQFTITNPNPIPLAGYNFLDNLPAAVTIAATPNVVNSCGGTVTAPGGGSSIALASGTVGANASCSILVDVTSSTLGDHLNVSEPLFVDTLDTGNVATATLTVNNAPPPPACVPNTEAARWTMAPVDGVGVPPLFFSKHPDVASALASFTGSALPGVQSINTTEGNPANSWSGTGWGLATAVVSDGPGAGVASYFEFTLDTSAFSTNPAEPLGISIDVNPTPTGNWAQPSNITVNVHASADGGAFTRIINANPVERSLWTTLTGSFTPGLTSTRFRVNITGRSNGNANATFLIDNAIFTGCGPGAPGTVPDPPSLTKAFVPALIGVGHTSTLSFTLSNPNATVLTEASFDDELPAGVTVAFPANASTTCGGGPTWSPVAGDTLLNFSGGSIPANGSCSVSVDVTSSSVGTALNISGFISALESGGNNGPTGSATAALTVLASPGIAKEFDPSLVLLGITPGDVSTLEFSVTNPNPSNAIAGVSFSDTFPVGLVVANPPNASSTNCGLPVWAPSAGSGAVNFSAGSIAAAGTCTVRVDVTGPTGNYPNVSSAVSHLVSGVPASNGLTAGDVLVIDEPIPGIALSKQVGLTNDLVGGTWVDYLAVAPGTNVFYRFSIENIGETVLNTITLTDPTLGPLVGCTPPASLPVADAGAPTAHIYECVFGPVTANLPGVFPNTATANAVGGATPVNDSDSATYATASLSIVKTASPLTYTMAGEVISYSFLVTNDGDAILAGPITVTDDQTTDESCPALSTVGNFDNFFDPGESITCTASYTITGTDVTDGSVVNIASATNGTFTSPTDTETVATPTPPPAPPAPPTLPSWWPGSRHRWDVPRPTCPSPRPA